jgi:hypothetical protein
VKVPVHMLGCVPSFGNPLGRAPCPIAFEIMVIALRVAGVGQRLRMPRVLAKPLRLLP